MLGQFIKCNDNFQSCVVHPIKIYDQKYITYIKL